MLDFWELLFDLLENKAQVVLDGDTGEVVWHLAPTEEENYRKKLKQQEQEKTAAGYP